MASDTQTLSVAQLVRNIKMVLEHTLGDVCVEGEISNFKRQASGHCYFTLKDEASQIGCVFFKGSASRCPVSPHDGLKVKLIAEVSVYEPRGQVQLIVKSMQEAGRGSLQQQFEELKRKLLGEGLFDAERKREIPAFPQTVGIITSPTGAVIQDIRHVFERRAPWIQLYLYPVRVQGAESAPEIVRALTEWNTPDKHNLPSVDILIVGRGGGSLEDLWPFNEESVARAIAASGIPVISAVGHETDFTIADFVADLRAPTPTAAAEMSSPDGPALSLYIKQRWDQAKISIRKLWENYTLRLDVYSRGVLSTSPTKVLRDHIQRVDEQEADLDSVREYVLGLAQQNSETLALKLAAHHPGKSLDNLYQRLAETENRLYKSVKNMCEKAESKQNELEKLLYALGPESAFQRGYALARDSQGRILRDAQSVHIGENITVTLAKGNLDATVSSQS